MAVGGGALKLGRAMVAKRGAPLSFSAKVSIAVVLGLGFVIFWSAFSPSSSPSVVSEQRSNFDDVYDPVVVLPAEQHHRHGSKPKQSPSPTPPTKSQDHTSKEKKEPKEENSEVQKNNEETAEKVEAEEKSEETVGIEEEDGGGGEDVDLVDGVEIDPDDDEIETTKQNKKKKKKQLGPLFHPAAKYEWKVCGGKGMHNFIPCVDMEGMERLQNHRHHERSCTRSPVTCLVPIPHGYKQVLPWPERQSKVWYKNVGHPKLSAYMKSHSWLSLSGNYLLFPPEQSEIKGGAQNYLDSLEEMVPDIEWGKNIRLVLDIGCSDAGFGAALLEKNVLTLTLGLMNDQTDLAQLALERGIPAVVNNLGTRRLPFPSGVFDVVHCSECNIQWYSNGGRLLLETNRILRPGGYFIFSTRHGDFETEEGMSTLTASICWNILAHKTDELSEMGLRIYQRPASNDIYELRRRKEPPFCKEFDNQDAAWYTPMKTCLHKVPAAIEERGSDWPEEWPKRLESFPEWLGDSRKKLIEDDERWKAVVNRSYMDGLGIDWLNVRNIMDMKAVYGGFAAALSSHAVWVMNVVPVHAPNTLPIIFERGLFGIYHDWCEPFSTYPRSYDLLHADHLFSRLKNRCKLPIVIVVEMDRILRPGGWVIIRDKLEILNPLGAIFKSMHWDIRMTYGKDREGIFCVQKTTWMP